MAYYPRLYDDWFPELAHFGSKKERKKILAQAAILSFANILLLQFCIGLIFLNRRYYVQYVGEWGSYFFAILLIAMICFGILKLQTKRIRSYLHEQLLSENIIVCRKCAYDLRGQVQPRCPECGQAFDLALLKQKEPVSTTEE